MRDACWEGWAWSRGERLEAGLGWHRKKRFVRIPGVGMLENRGGHRIFTMTCELNPLQCQEGMRCE